MAIFKRGDSYYWWYSFKLPGQQRISASTKTTDKKLAQKIHDIERGKALEGRITKAPKKVLLKKLVSDYLKLNFSGSPNQKLYAFALKAILKEFGEQYASEITTKSLEQYRMKRQKEVMKSTLNKEMALLKAAYNCALKWGDIMVNPTKPIKFFNEKENRRTRHLSQPEKEKLLKSFSNNELVQKIVGFTLRTGMRRGEILNLKWTSVDFEKGIITVEKSKGGDKRYIPIHQDVYLIFDSLPRESEYVFSYRDRRVNINTLRSAFIRGIQHSELENFHFHDLRHSFAADYLAMGGTMRGLQEVLGHSNILMTQRYSHLSKDFIKESVSILPSLKKCYDFATVLRDDVKEWPIVVEDQSSAGGGIGRHATLRW